MVTYEQWLEDNEEYLLMLHDTIQERGRMSGRMVFDKSFADFCFAAYSSSTLYPIESREFYQASDEDDDADDEQFYAFGC